MATRTYETSVKSALRKHFADEMASVERLINAANYDLYYGPTPEGDEPDGDGWQYPGFESACEQIARAFDDIGTMYYDDDCDYLSTSEPQGEEDEETGEWIEPSPYYQLERRDILKYLVGRELAQYL